MLFITRSPFMLLSESAEMTQVDLVGISAFTYV